MLTSVVSAKWNAPMYRHTSRVEYTSIVAASNDQNIQTMKLVNFFIEPL